MKESTVATQLALVELSPSAPQVRVTAGLGAPTQKTWNLRKPVTLIGSRRPANIVLHDEGVSKAHCVLVNTGKEVLIKDLHSSSGTFVNNSRVELAVLSDGDVVTVGETKIQVAIQVPQGENDDSGCGLEFDDPLRFRASYVLRLEHTQSCWRLSDAVALIGRHEKAEIRLDHQTIGTRHALVFRFGDSPAFFDLAGKDGINIKGERCPMGIVQDGDRVGIGPFTLAVCGESSSAATSPSALAAVPVADTPAVNEQPVPKSEVEEPVEPSPAQAPAAPRSILGVDGDPTKALAQIEHDLGALQKNISESWDRFNAWENHLRNEDAGVSTQQSNLAAKEAELEARDAYLRGQLHDLSRYHEQIAARERDLAVQLAKLQEARDQLLSSKKEQEGHEAELAKRIEEVKRREQVLAQRWTRLLTARCPKCGSPINTGQN